jgi:inhibitor of cysteine peptidase
MQVDRRRYGSLLFLTLLCLVATIVIISATVTEGQDKMVAQVQQKFQIKLPENPSTGFSWEASFDSNFLTLESRNYVDGGTGRRGGGGVAIFSFVPLKEGNTSLAFRYKRPWEKTVEQEKSFHVTITK